MKGLTPGRHAALVGPTASGKSAVALAWAERAGDVEIVAVDSMQVYRGMDIGTATPTLDEQTRVPHHLIDLVDPADEFTVARFQSAARDVLTGIEARSHRALLVGGTGLHLQAIVDDLDIPGRYPEVREELDAEQDTAALHGRLTALDPEAAARMEPSNRRRVVRALEVTIGAGRGFSTFGPGLDEFPPTPFRLLGLWLPREVVRQRIERRYHRQVDAGFVGEVRALVDEGSWSRTAAEALGYRELAAHLAGETPLDDALERAIVRTRQFARRQRMWFRRDPRIRWLVGTDPAPFADLAAPLPEPADAS